jgi:UDP-glucose 4-epimerase
MVDMSDATQVKAAETVAVTGASGFLGSHLIEQLSASGRYRVIGADTTRNARSALIESLPRVEFREIDLRDRDSLVALTTDSDSIVHLAALRPRAVDARPRQAFEVNVIATYDLIELAAEHGVRRIVFGSSHAVYGPFKQPRTFRFREHETGEAPNVGMYGASKLAVEAYLSAHAASGGPDYISLRLGTVYGPRVNRDNSLGGMMLDAVAAVRRGDRPVVQWHPDAIHDLVYVADAAKAIVAALETTAKATAINIVGPPLLSTTVFGTLVELVGGDPADIDWQPDRVRYQLVSQDKMLAILGPILDTTLSDGLQAFIEWGDADLAATPTGAQGTDR